MDQVIELDLSRLTVRELNQYLHHELARQRPVQVEIANPEGRDGLPRMRNTLRLPARVEILNPNGMHNLAVGLDTPAMINIRGHAGYFIGAMNKKATITVHGNVGWSVAENIMSGTVRVNGCASECAGASGHGGLVVIEGDASSRCGISMKGCDIVVGGDVGHLSAFMAQAGTLVVCGDAGPYLGDSLYEAVIYVRGRIHSFGNDAREESMTSGDHERLATLLQQSGFGYSPNEFKRVASARTLYHWHADAGAKY